MSLRSHAIARATAFPSNRPERTVSRIPAPIAFPDDLDADEPPPPVGAGSTVFGQVLERMHREDAREAAADAAVAAGIEAEGQAERDAAQEAHEAMVARRLEIERAISDEVELVAAERGHAEPDSHDAALALSNVAARFGAESDRVAAAEVLEREPGPVDPLDYRPIR